MARPLAVLIVIELLIVATIGVFIIGITRGDEGMVRLGLSFGTFWLLLCIVLVFYLMRAPSETVSTSERTREPAL